MTATTNGHQQRDQLEIRAHALIARADGLADAGQTELAHHIRHVSNALLETLNDLGTERAARAAIQARNAQLEQIIGKAAYQACREAAP